jgi:hypothetical protein
MSEEQNAQIEDNSVHQDYEVITEKYESYPGSSDSNESKEETPKDEQAVDNSVKDEQSNEDSSKDEQAVDEQKIQDADIEQIKKFGNVIKGIVGGFMKEFIPKINEAKTNIKDILSNVLDQVEKENTKQDSDEQSNASDDLDKLVKEIEEEFRSIKDRSTMNIIVPSNDEVEEEETKDADEDQQDEDYDENEEEQQEDDDDEEDEDYDENEEEQDDAFWEMYDDRCKFVVSVDDKPIGYFDEFRKAQKYIIKIYNQFVSSRLGSFLRTERSVDTIKVYTKTPYLWFIYAEQLCFNATIDTVYRFKVDA